MLHNFLRRLLMEAVMAAAAKAIYNTLVVVVLFLLFCCFRCFYLMNIHLAPFARY